jgi:hypothetical protein
MLALSSKKTETDPSVFNFYVYLRTHPLITRCQSHDCCIYKVLLSALMRMRSML